MHSKFIFFILCLSFSSLALSQLSVCSLFSDNMILQRNDTIKIWGTSPKPVMVKASWLSETLETKPNENGKWTLWLPTTDAGGPYQLSIHSKQVINIENVVLGDVWICGGQSNMEMPLAGFLGEPVSNSNQEIISSKNNNIRWISVPRNATNEPQTEFEGAWKIANLHTTGEISAAAYFFAKLIYKTTGVPIGLVDVNYGGSNIEAWMSKASLDSFFEVTIPQDIDEIDHPYRTATLLYNGMLAPVIGYTVKGAIWYQGESNANQPMVYEALFPSMVELWRKDWDQGEFPFYYAQIAPFNYDMFYPIDDLPWYANSAYLRDAQRKAQYKIPHSAMISLLDAGDMQTIHPMDKQTPGERLALAALAKTYGYKGFGYATPDYDELNIEDSLVTITFKNLPNGLTSYGKPVNAFEIAGEDRIFHPAKCKVRRKSVQVWTEQVKKPVAIRYAFTNEGPAQLFSTEGIPVTSFRTDDWHPEHK